MANNELNTEMNILEAASEVFQLFGYHGTTIRMIADKAAVNTAAIHYYFRSKENIYSIVLLNNLSLLLNVLNHGELHSGNKSNEPFVPDATKDIETEMIAWFLINEIRTNNHFVREMIRTDDKMNRLITSIFSIPENLEIFKSLVILQLSKIINQDLLTKSDPIEQALE